MIAQVENQVTEEQFAAWQESKRGIADIAEKAPEDRAPQEQTEYDAFVEEVRKIVPGSDQLSPEQLRSLAIALDLSDTRHAGRQIRSLDDAVEYVGSQLRGDSQRMPVADARVEDLSYLAPNTGGAPVPEREQETEQTTQRGSTPRR